MEQQTKIQLEQFKNQFKNYESYIKSTDWSKDKALASESYKTEASLASSILDNLNRFIKENETDLHLKEVIDFFKFSLKLLNSHVDRIEKYLKANDWTTTFKNDKEDLLANLAYIKENDSHLPGAEEEIKILENLIKKLEKDKREEIEFQKSLFDQKTKVSLGISTLNISSEDNKKSLVNLFYSDKKAPLLMREYLSKQVPIVKERSEALDINWGSPNPSTSKEMFINMNPKDIPPYDPNKHFFEQPLSTIQFWEEEIRKIKYGININGFQLSPWLYWHCNFFSLNQGAEDDKDVKVAQFRDNEYFFDHMWRKARKEQKEGLLVYGTRRYSKSSIQASHTLHKQITITNSEGQLVAFSTEDLGNLRSYMEVAVENLPPALGIEINVNSDKEFNLGVKKNAQRPLTFSSLNILNLDAGKKKASQKTAGGTPDVVVFDEIGKGNVLTPYIALRPALQKGKRTTALLAGTGNGDEQMSADAENMLRNFDTYGILPMDWDFLEQISDPEYYTWKRTNFSMFVPAQMNLNTPKIITNLNDYLNKNDGELSKIEIQVTDWKTATEGIYEERAKLATDHKALASELIFHPIETDEVFMSSKVNPFDAIGIKNHKQELITKEKTGTKVRFYKDENNTIQFKITNDPTVDVYPFRGGNLDAPTVLYEILDSNNPPPFGMYVIGLDDIKHDKSSGDSVLSATVYKRGIELDEWADRIVCSYDTRPEKKDIAYRNLYMIMKYYNAIVFPENEDNGFVDFLERNYPNDAFKHLANSVDFANSMGFENNRNRRVGYTPTGKNNRHLNNRVLAYTREDIDAKEGEETKRDGYTRISHIMLLEEMINYKEGANADRLRSFGMALIYAEYLDKNHMFISRRKFNTQEDDTPKKKVVMNRGFTKAKRKKKW